MPIELAGIQLNRVHKVTTLEQAAFVYHRIPGLEGNVVQDLGRDSVRLQVEGIFYGSKAKEDLETLRKVYKKREAVDFLAEIVGQAYFGQVTLERFEVAQIAGAPDQFSYLLVVTEYVEPPPTAAAGASAVDTAVSLEAQAFMDMASLPDLLQMGQIPELTNPAAPMNGALTQVTDASSGVAAITESIGSLFQLNVEPTPEAVKLPDDWGQSPELTWVSPPPQSATGPSQLFGANGELLAADGKPQLGVNGAILGPDGKPLLNPNGALLGADGKPITGPNGEVLGADGQPLRGPNGELLGADGKPLPTGWLVIELKDEEGTAVANASYTVTLPDGTTRQGTLDTQGQARIENLPDGDLILTFPDLDAADWLPPSPDDEPTGDGTSPDTGDGTDGEQPTGDGTTPSAETGWLVIELKDEEGTAVANASYILTLPDGTTRQGTFDIQGQARLENLPHGDLSLTFPDLDAADWLPSSLPSPDVEPTGDGTPPDTGDGTDGEQPTGDGTPSSAETGWLVIELRDEEGTAVANASYTLTLPDGTTHQGALDAQGQAHLENLPHGDLSLTFPDLDAADWQPPSVSPSPDTGDKPTPGDEPTGDGVSGDQPTDDGITPIIEKDSLAIELVDEDGRPVAGARYVVTLQDGMVYEGTLDEQGQAQIEAVVVGSYTLTFPDFDAGDWDTAGTEEDAPQEPEQPTLQTNWLLIELADENGRSAPNVRYTLTRADGITHEGVLDEQGQAWLENLPGGDLTLAFPDLDGRDWDNQPPEPVLPTGWLVIELKTEDGTAVANTRYTLTLSNGTIYEGTLDERGQARIENLELNNYTLSFPNLDTNDWAEG